ncbi:hypothetical protein [Janibacter sp. G1551]|uniref:hypothetical protein n=1 Tax=Janibacter sp. G1551 TaxID=3420440 RepID=UPI003D0069FF
MSILSVLLLSVALADLARTGRMTRPAATGVAALVGVAAVAILGALTDLATAGDITLLVVAAVTTVAWVVLSGRALRAFGADLAALAALGVGILALLLWSGHASPVRGPFAHWLGWTGLAPGLDPGRALLLMALVALQLSTGNVIVRLVLGAVGAIRPSGEPQPSDSLKGGRLLGPMERILILGLGLAGQLTAAGIVIAAKGLIRFPELQAKRNDSQTVTGVGIDAVTEYFLVGSFVSWLIALTSLAAVHLGTT